MALCLAWSFPSPAQETPANPATAASAGLPEETPEIVGLLQDAYELIGQGKLDLALRKVDTVLQLDPKDIRAYAARANIFTRQKLWERAQQDYETAYKIAPSVTELKYDIADTLFLQKLYDEARAGFLALKDDKQWGDAATYQVFLCDLLSGRDDAASKELAEVNKVGAGPAYYFCNAAWDLAHHKSQEANQFFASAARLYDKATQDRYISSLLSAQNVHGTHVTFTTKEGRTYAGVEVYIESDGLRFRTTEGWTNVPFTQLSNDLSVFPQDLRQEIIDLRQISPLAPNNVNRATFTTTLGKHYDQSQVLMMETGISVLTPDGWIPVPFKQLPDDLSAFPKDLQKEIAVKRLTAPDLPPDLGLISFTTKTGRHYDQTRVSLVPDGLSVLTPDGWFTIPFKQLPDDLSPFPGPMQQEIAAKRLSAPDEVIDMTSYSFITKQGRHYDQVQVSMEDTGLRVLTPDGWFTVPFKQLPDDLTLFPPDLRKQIEAKQQEEEAALEIRQAAQLAHAHDPSPDVAAEQAHGVGHIDPEQTDLYPAGAKDCLFGTCVALEGSTLAVGSNGATYVYEDAQLKARLCPDADATHTGDWVNSVSLSDHTLAIGTHRGVYIYLQTSEGWKLQAHLDIINLSTVSLDHDHLVVATNGKGMTSGLISFYLRKGETWTAVPMDTRYKRDDYSADFFGHLVALKGQRALIGAPNWSHASYEEVTSLYSGHVYLFKYDGTLWKEETELSPDDNGAGANQFGESVALSDDLIAISSGNHDHIDYAPHHGIVYIFHRENDAWKEDAPLRGPDPAHDEGFGHAPIAISQHTLLIGDSSVPANVQDVTTETGVKSGKPGSIKKAGAVYVYEDQVLQATLMAPDPVDSLNYLGSPDQYGGSLAVSGDVIAVGAAGKEGGAGGVYVWKRQNNQWHLETELKGFRTQPDFHY